MSTPNLKEILYKRAKDLLDGSSCDKESIQSMKETYTIDSTEEKEIARLYLVHYGKEIKAQLWW